ncbi:MAG: sigma-70 family RNA polymerase sigma factor [Bacteriovoracaceae bacterium]|nr:sigma-70 family RNA polymerase sigma factor [Bacteriovoracaceae bacterium]
MYSDKTDKLLMRDYQNGDFGAFDAIYDRHKAKVYAYIRSKLKAQNIDEVFQEVFLKFHRFRMNYKEKYPFLPWLFTLTKNVIVDYLRRESKHQNNVTFTTDTHDIHAIPRPTSTDFQDAEVLVGKLNKNQKKAVEMRFSDDFSFEEIAMELKTTPSNARQLVSRAIKRMKSLAFSNKEIRNGR